MPFVTDREMQKLHYVWKQSGELYYGKTTKRKSLMGTFNYIIMLPVIFIGIVMAVISYILIKKNVYYEIRSGMENEAYTIANTYDVMYPGYYELVKAENLMALKKGEHYLTNDFIDNIKEDTGLEITIFTMT